MIGTSSSLPFRMGQRKQFYIPLTEKLTLRAVIFLATESISGIKIKTESQERFQEISPYMPEGLRQINSYFSEGVPANKFLFARTDRANKFLFAGRVPANNLFHQTKDSQQE